MRCNSCNKFVSNDEQEPEVNSIEVDEDGRVTAEVRIVNACQECGQELTEYNFDGIEADHSADCADHKGEGHELSVEETGVERTQPDLQRQTKVGCKTCKRTGKKGRKPCPECDGTGKVNKPIPYRYRKTYYGFKLDFTITCSCGFTVSCELEDAVQASDMDEIQ